MPIQDGVRESRMHKKGCKKQENKSNDTGVSSLVVGLAKREIK